MTGVQTCALPICGPTIVSAGALALSGGALITNSASIVVASNAIFNVSGLTNVFTLQQSSSQTLSNSAPGAIINGTNNCSAGTLSLVYNGVNPSFIITNGGMTLSVGTTIKVNNTGAQLAAGSYTLITNTASGNAGYVAGAVTSPVTVDGFGAVGPATLAVSANRLVLTVIASGPASNSLALAASPGTTVGYKDSVSYTATVTNLVTGTLATNATGPVIFYYNAYGTNISNTPFWTNSPVLGVATSVTISNQLPRGTNLITAEYAGDPNYLGWTNSLIQTVTNHPPTITTMSIVNPVGQQLLIALSDLATNWSDSIDGDVLSLTNLTATSSNFVNLETISWTNNVAIGTNNANFTNAYIGYTNNPNGMTNDRISYVISDGFTSVTGYIQITANFNPITGQGSIGYTNTTPTLTFYGVPGYTYMVQRSPDLSAWIDISTNYVIPGTNNPVITITDTNNPSAFYRLKWQP